MFSPKHLICVGPRWTTDSSLIYSLCPEEYEDDGILSWHESWLQVTYSLLGDDTCK